MSTLKRFVDNAKEVANTLIESGLYEDDDEVRGMAQEIEEAVVYTKKEPYVALVATGPADGRQICEQRENMEFLSLENARACFRGLEPKFLPLTDFMDEINNGDFDPSEVWFSYFYIVSE